MIRRSTGPSWYVGRRSFTDLPLLALSSFTFATTPIDPASLAVLAPSR